MGLIGDNGNNGDISGFVLEARTLPGDDKYEARPHHESPQTMAQPRGE